MFNSGNEVLEHHWLDWFDWGIALPC